MSERGVTRWRRIHRSGGGVRVACDRGLVVRGKRVIVAMAPTLAGRIEYQAANEALAGL